MLDKIMQKVNSSNEYLTRRINMKSSEVDEIFKLLSVVFAAILKVI